MRPLTFTLPPVDCLDADLHWHELCCSPLTSASATTCTMIELGGRSSRAGTAFCRPPTLRCSSISARSSSLPLPRATCPGCSCSEGHTHWQPQLLCSTLGWTFFIPRENNSSRIRQMQCNSLWLFILFIITFYTSTVTTSATVMGRSSFPPHLRRSLLMAKQLVQLIFTVLLHQQNCTALRKPALASPRRVLAEPLSVQPLPVTVRHQHLVAHLQCHSGIVVDGKCNAHSATL